MARLRNALLAAALAALPEGGQDAPCLQGLTAQTCAGCHRDDADARFARDRLQPCAALCLTCHAAKDMEKHHTIGGRLERPLHQPLRLDGRSQLTCCTCHHLGRPRYDQVRWKAESLFDRFFRRQERHKTYLLAVRNDRGQLCRACH